MNVKWVGIAPNLMQTCTTHSHDEWEIVLNMKGFGKTIVNGEEYSFYPGHIMCLPPHTPHEKYSENDFEDIFLRVETLFVPTFASDQDVVIFNDDEEKSLETLLMMLHRIYHKKEKNYLLVVESLGETISQLLHGWYSREQKNESVELFKNNLIKNFTNPEFKVSEALLATAYCSDHFRRRFKADTGMTPTAYLNGLRVEYAKKLLSQIKTTRLSVSEISHLSGFYDPLYFSRLFKRYFGKSPWAYAKDED